MKTITFEVRKNQLVLTFDVTADGLGTINQDAFHKKAPGIYVYEARINTGASLTIGLTIYGPGSDGASPTAICLTALEEQLLKPYVSASVKAGRTKAHGEVVYPITNGVSSGNGHGIPTDGISLEIKVAESKTKKSK